MPKNEKMVQAITSRDQDFAQWYTDIVRQAELCSYSSVRGCVILRPYGCAIWEQIQQHLDQKLKATGHHNVKMPIFIPESLLQKEKDHVEGFAPEVAWVTHGGSEELPERLCVRPTSEVLFCDHYAEIIQSWRDLPKLYNQWVSVVRWEKTTRPFLRTREFFWQEGHTAHATREDAMQETQQMLNIYADFYKDVLAIPVIKGVKTESEKFAGAEVTYTVEAMMHDGKALQSGTSHYFGDGFAKAFGITYTDKNNEQKFVHQTSWGLSSRSIGGIIMVHGDDDGLVLPYKIAPIQIVVVPIAQHKGDTLAKAREIAQSLAETYRVKLDDSDKMPGWKFAEYEMKGVPVRLEVGPRDLANNSCVLVTRDNRAKTVVKLDDLPSALPQVFADYQQRMYENARQNLQQHLYSCTQKDDFFKTLTTKPGFVDAPWCGSKDCEKLVKDETTATARCITEAPVDADEVCAVCGKKAKHHVIWGKSY